MKRVLLDKEFLKDLYIDQKLTTYQIADKFGCSQGTIWKRLQEYKIKARNPWSAVDLNKEILENWYLNKKLSTWEIQKIFGYPRSTIHRRLKEFGINSRNIASSHIRFPRKDFSGDILEKAYLVGFRIGDLNVTKCGSKSETIVVKCASTQQGQLELFKNLFAHYGHIIQGKPTKEEKVNIQANLNLSFSFLLDKKYRNYRWVFKRKKTFFAFLAGFSDAEGSFMVNNQGQAIYALGNYDHKLLHIIKKFLFFYNIKIPKFGAYFGKGLLAKNGYVNNGNYYTLRCSRKKYLLKLMSYLKPFLQHPDKVAKIKELEQNISQRNTKYNNLNMD